MTPIIRIPKPCHEDWNVMTPNEQGRHCASCAKTVVDFTTWSNEDILRYLKKHSAAKVCGRFTKEQAVGGLPSLDISSAAVVRQVARSRMGWLQKVAAIVVLGLSVTFATGCGEEMGKAEQVDQSTGVVLLDPPPIVADTTPHEVLGEMRIAAPDAKDSSACVKPPIPPKKPSVKIVEAPPIITGEPAMPEAITGAPIPMPEPPPQPEKVMGGPQSVPDSPPLMGKPAVPEKK